MADNSELRSADPAVRRLQVAVVAGAILINILLVDAAVETFLAGASVRWIVVGTVVAYVALSVLIRRKLTLEASASASLFILLGLLAFTAWRPGGMSAGVVLLRQPTSTVLVAVTALATVTAGWILLRATLLPVIGKIVAGLLTVYGATALAWGVVAATPYPDLFHGHSVWTRLPFWLQGAFIGGLVLLPAAFAITLVVRILRTEVVHRRAWVAQVAALSLTLAIAAAGFMAPAGSGGIGAEGRSTAAVASLTSRETGIEQPEIPQPTLTPNELVRMLRAYQKLPQTAGRSSFDVKAKAASLHDITAAFAFVRDEIANAAYPGVLRGAEGTLSARAGNDLDKAVLLAALLIEQQRDVRYTLCTLDDERARQRIEAMFAPVPVPEHPDLGQAMQEAFVREGIPVERSAEIIKAMRRVRGALDAIVDEMASRDFSIVRDALGRAGISPRPVDEQAALLADARSHYWIQVRDGDRWRDLDAAFPVSQPGDVFCSATEVVERLPDKVYQSVVFRVRNDYGEGESRHSDVVLEHRETAADLRGKSIALANLAIPESQPQEAASDTDEFVPVLLIGDKTLSGERFRLRRSMQGDTSLFAGGELGGEAAAAGPDFVAQRVEFEFSAGDRRSTVSRTIIETTSSETPIAGSLPGRGDLAAIRALLAQPHAIGISVGRLDPIEAIRASYTALDVGASARVFGWRSGATLPEQLGQDAATIEVPLLTAYAQLLVWASERTLTASWRRRYPHARLFRGQPMVVIADSLVRRTAEGSWRSEGVSIDLRHNVVLAVPQSARWAEEAYWANAHHGMIDAALERHLLAYVTASDGSSALVETLSTSAIFELARAQKLDTRAAAGSEAIRLLRHESFGTGGRRLALEITDDVAAVLPAGPVRVHDEDRAGMWTLDLSTGHLMAILDTQLRQAIAERRSLEDVRRAHQKYLDCVAQTPLSAGSMWSGPCHLQWRLFARILNQHAGFPVWPQVGGGVPPIPLPLP